MGFPKIRGTLFGGHENKDPTIAGTKFGSPIFENSHRVEGFGCWWGYRVQRESEKRVDNSINSNKAAPGRMTV